MKVVKSALLTLGILALYALLALIICGLTPDPRLSNGIAVASIVGGFCIIPILFLAICEDI